MYRQSEKTVEQQYLPHMSSQYGGLRPTSLRSVGDFGAPMQISTGFIIIIIIIIITRIFKVA